MNIQIPVNRNQVGKLLKAVMSALIAGKVTLEFSADNVEGDAILLSKAQAKELQLRHMELTTKATLLEELVAETIESLPADSPLLPQLQDGLDSVQTPPRVFH